MTLTVPEREEAVRRLHGYGLSDQQIADRLHMNARTALRTRQRLELAPNYDSGRTTA